MSETTIRPVERRDEADWRRLWSGYLAFYETTRPESVYATTWARLFDDNEPIYCFVAEKDGQLIGLVHLLYHRHTWFEADICYLQDLYVDPAVRGTGAGRALIEAVYAAAEEAGACSVYWTTQQFNRAGRDLYDRIGRRTPFIKYAHP